MSGTRSGSASTPPARPPTPGGDAERIDAGQTMLWRRAEACRHAAARFLICVWELHLVLDRPRAGLVRQPEPAQVLEVPAQVDTFRSVAGCRQNSAGVFEIAPQRGLGLQVPVRGARRPPVVTDVPQAERRLRRPAAVGPEPGQAGEPV